MLSSKRFQSLQMLFFNKLNSCCNSVTVKLIFFTLTGGDRISNFTGDNKRTENKVVDLHCLYQRDLNDKQREKLGVGQEVTDVIYITPIELEKKTGSNKFPEEVRKSFAMIAVEFLGQHYELLNIKDLEPMHNGKEVMCLAYQLNLRHTTGNRDYN